MPAGLAADTRSVAPVRRVRLTLLCALLVCACAPSSSGLGAQATKDLPQATKDLHYKGGTRLPHDRNMRCARRANFHGGHIRDQLVQLATRGLRHLP